MRQTPLPWSYHIQDANNTKKKKAKRDLSKSTGYFTGIQKAKSLPIFISYNIADQSVNIEMFSFNAHTR
jgi:hypothetical protein